MKCNRRTFVNRSVAVVGALMTGAAAAQAAAKGETVISFRA
jgi:hypothetical protein